MSFILSLETSAKICSVAIHNQGRLVATSEVHVEQSHASKLATLIDQVRNLAGIQVSQLEAVAISSGPGSYTGLRIGTSVAKGLCFSLEIPLISIGSLELMAYQVNALNHQDAYLCPMIDARRMEVYCMITDDSLRIIHPIEAKIIEELSFSEYLEKNNILFFGDGSDKCREKILHPNAHFISGIYPMAAEMGILAYQKLKAKEVEDTVNFEPYYLKEFMTKKPKTVSE